MTEAVKRISASGGQQKSRALAVVSDAVWWVTIVDATLVRHHTDSYDAALSEQDPAQREVIEGTLAGLRFVRNCAGSQAGDVDFIRRPAPPHHPTRAGDWSWKPVPESVLTLLAPSSRAWERARYRSYEAHLAGHMTAEASERAAEFLALVAYAASGSQAKVRTRADGSQHL